MGLRKVGLQRDVCNQPFNTTSCLNVDEGSIKAAHLMLIHLKKATDGGKSMRLKSSQLVWQISHVAKCKISKTLHNFSNRQRLWCFRRWCEAPNQTQSNPHRVLLVLLCLCLNLHCNACFAARTCTAVYTLILLQLLGCGVRKGSANELQPSVDN